MKAGDVGNEASISSPTSGILPSNTIVKEEIIQ